MAKIKIDRQSRLFYILVPDQRFYTREFEVSDEVYERIQEFYRNQQELEKFLERAYLSVEGQYTVPGAPAFLTGGDVDGEAKEPEEKEQVRAKRPAKSKGSGS
jgi:hypothetical protein